MDGTLGVLALQFVYANSPMNCMLRKRIMNVLSIGLAAASVILTWLLVGTSSPLVQNFSPKAVPFSETWVRLHSHFYLVYVLFRPSEAIWTVLFYCMVFIQWLLIGLAIGFLFKRRT